MTRTPLRLLAAMIALPLLAGGVAAQLQLPAGPKAAPAKPQKPVEKPSIEKINAYFNAISGLTADFVQTSSDGRRFSGRLHVLRPGRMLFDYNPPAALEIVADGRSVAIRDRKLNTQDLYLIGQTPLKFLLADRIDVARDSQVIGLATEAEDVVLTLEDRSTIGGTSRIRVVFDGEELALRQWTVTDPQGYDTTVRLSNIDLTQKPRASLFRIEYVSAVGRGN